jgi:hypothetical protein
MEPFGKRSIWGLSPLELHDRFWVGRGIQVVRPGTELKREPRTDAYLLLDGTKLVLFNPASALSRLHWINPVLLTIRLRHTLRWNCSADAVQEHGGVCSYLIPHRDISGRARSRAVITTEPEIAMLWSNSVQPRTTWRSIRRRVPQQQRAACCLNGVVATGAGDSETSTWIGHLTSAWRRPDRTLDHCQRVSDLVYKDVRSPLAHRARSDVPVWIGFGRESVPPVSRGGPMILWDAGVPSEPIAQQGRLPRVETSRRLQEPR